MTPADDFRGHGRRQRTGHTRAVRGRVDKMAEAAKAAEQQHVNVAMPGNWDEMSAAIADIAMRGPTFGFLQPLPHEGWSIEDDGMIILDDKLMEALAAIFKMWLMASVAYQAGTVADPYHETEGFGGIKVTFRVDITKPIDLSQAKRND